LNNATLQRLVPLHRKFRTFDHAEAIMNRKGMLTFTAYSAGSHPSGSVRPEALREIESAGLSTENFRSKSWNEFSKPDSPSLDFVFIVCDNAANEVCPLWPGQPMTAHWGIPDPAAVQGTPEEIEHAFSQAFTMLDRRISLFLCLSLATLDTFSLQKEIDKIGKRYTLAMQFHTQHEYNRETRCLR
jgi:arsenate reductase